MNIRIYKEIDGFRKILNPFSMFLNMFFGNVLIHSMKYDTVIAVVVAYILLGREILKSAAKNIWRGHVFDENFLKQMKLVKNRKEGKTVYYSLADEHIQRIINQGLEHITE